MGETAVRVAKAAGYTNAGTIEFLVDRQKNFYFLEMNTRLQVEHPVTEIVTGLDLVHLQIRIASGEKLAFTQQDVKLRGHAIECRIYAEDPDNNFFPSPGKITRLIAAAGPGVREDGGVYEGWTVPLDYDPMLSKLIGYAPTREMAIERLLRALEEYFVGGIKTNVDLFRTILRSEEFRTAQIDTGWLDRWLAGAQKAAAQKKNEESARLAAIAAAWFAWSGGNGVEGNGAAVQANGDVSSGNSAWKRTARAESLRGAIE
jgi:acetyl-CoA carboxylase biotin carboxylase subunit